MHMSLMLSSGQYASQGAHLGASLRKLLSACLTASQSALEMGVLSEPALATDARRCCAQRALSAACQLAAVQDRANSPL